MNLIAVRFLLTTVNVTVLSPIAIVVSLPSTTIFLKKSISILEISSLKSSPISPETISITLSISLSLTAFKILLMSSVGRVMFNLSITLLNTAGASERLNLRKILLYSM